MSREFSTKLTEAEIERLAVLSEELGEAQQAVGKILRHGYESYNPMANSGKSNRHELEKEIGDVCIAAQMLIDAKDLKQARIDLRMIEKVMSIRQWLHFQ